MSLIHDALKKAQGNESAPIGSGLASLKEPVPEEEPKRGLSRRSLILAAMLAVAVIFFIYTKFSSNGEKKEAMPPVPIAGASPAPVSPEDASRLKKSAVDAFSSQDFDAAWTNLQAALQVSKEDPEIWNNIGLVARKRGDVIKAREAYTKALELKPDYPECLNNMAVLEMQSGNTSKARELLEKSLALAPANPEANFHMALLYEQSGDKKKAVDYYKNFIKAGSTLPSSTIDAVRDHVMEIDLQ